MCDIERVKDDYRKTIKEGESLLRCEDRRSSLTGSLGEIFRKCENELDKNEDIMDICQDRMREMRREVEKEEEGRERGKEKGEEEDEVSGGTIEGKQLCSASTASTTKSTATSSSTFPGGSTRGNLLCSTSTASISTSTAILPGGEK